MARDLSVAMLHASASSARQWQPSTSALGPRHRVHLVGHPYGGAVALKLAAMYPRCVRSITLYEPVIFRWLLKACAMEIADVLDVVDAVRGHLAFGSAFDAARVFVDYWSGVGAFAGMAMRHREAIAARMRTVAAHMCIPTMVVTGAQTVRAMHRLADLIRAAWPAARHRVVGAAGHVGPATHAGEVNREVVAFVKGEATMAA